MNPWGAQGATATGMGTTGTTQASGFIAPYSGVYGHMHIPVSTADNSANTYNFGIYNATGTLICSTGAVAGSTYFATTSGGTVPFTSNCVLTQGSVYFFATGAISTSTLKSVGCSNVICGMGATPFVVAQVAATVMPSTITAPTVSYAITTTSNVQVFALYP